MAGIIDEFLEWTKANRSPKTYQWYRDYLQKFYEHIGPKLFVDKLKPIHVERWVQSSYPKASNNHRRGAIRSAQRALNWAVEMGLILNSPIARMKKPPAERREGYLTKAEFDKLLAKVKCERFRDYLRFLWFTGSRAMEIRLIEAKHLQDERIVLPVKESKGKKYNRTIYLVPQAMEIVKRLIVENPSGPIFRNQRGEPWTANAVRCRFRQLKTDGVCATTLRHSWVTQSLQNGLDTVTVAKLAGHQDATMVARIYSHLGDNHEYLAAAARRAIEGGGNPPA